MIFPLDGIECSGHLRSALEWLGGPELAAEYSAADYDALLAQLKEEAQPRRSAELGMKRGGPRSSTCHSCSSRSHSHRRQPTTGVDHERDRIRPLLDNRAGQ